MTDTNIQLTSLISEDNKLTLALKNIDMPQPGADEVVIRIEAAPLNPSDLAVLFSAADMTTATQAGTEQSPAIIADESVKPFLLVMKAQEPLSQQAHRLQRKH